MGRLPEHTYEAVICHIDEGVETGTQPRLFGTAFALAYFNLRYGI
jgi:hypothetical protein